MGCDVTDALWDNVPLAQAAQLGSMVNGGSGQAAEKAEARKSTIYVFTEHYPSTYKPYFDTQFAELLRRGHRLSIFAFGKWDATLSQKVVHWKLDGLTHYLPQTLRTLPVHLPRALARSARHPSSVASAAMRASRASHTRKERLLNAARAMLLPGQPPDLCLIHNLVTAQSFGFLRRLYPTARQALYFHGGEVPQGGTIDDENTQRAFSQMDVVLTNTEYSRRLAILRGCPAEKVVVNPVGFCLEDYVPPRQKTYLRGGYLRLLSVGRLSEEKGILHALEAVRILLNRGLRHFSYDIIGHGPQSASLREYVEKHSLGRHVQFWGELSSDEVRIRYEEADALILPSVATPKWEETQACVVQEAMLMKLLVVATKSGGVQESLAPALRRFSVSPGSPEAIAYQVLELLSLDESALRDLGEAGRRFAETRYDVRRVTRDLLSHGVGHALARSMPKRTRKAFLPQVPAPGRGEYGVGMANPMEKEHERELQRLRELEEKDLEVEAKRGRRPLEGLSRGPTNWTQDQDDSAAAEVHAHDEEESVNESERQARGEYPADPAVVGTPEQP